MGGGPGPSSPCGARDGRRGISSFANSTLRPSPWPVLQPCALRGSLEEADGRPMLPPRSQGASWNLLLTSSQLPLVCPTF